MGIDLVFIEEVQPRHLSPETNEKKKKGNENLESKKKKKCSSDVIPFDRRPESFMTILIG